MFSLHQIPTSKKTNKKNKIAKILYLRWNQSLCRGDKKESHSQRKDFYIFLSKKNSWEKSWWWQFPRDAVWIIFHQILRSLLPSLAQKYIYTFVQNLILNSSEASNDTFKIVTFLHFYILHFYFLFTSELNYKWRKLQSCT